MSKTLVGIVTFGNLEFTKLTIQSIIDTTKEHEIDFYVVVGKPGDTETDEWLTSMGISHAVHLRNFGFPYSLNDIYDFAWKTNNYDNLIIAGNDIIAYDYCVDSLIQVADTTNYECISAIQYDVKSLVSEFPETREHFVAEEHIFTEFGVIRPWDKFTNFSKEINIVDMQLYDIQNLCLYKKSIFEKVGYTDVAFYPAYFVDNDYAMRMLRSNVKFCSLQNARFFHFWSRTIHQGSGGSTNKNFEKNKSYYRSKWGGDVGKEKVTPTLYIGDRVLEEQIIEHWSK